MKCPPHPRLLQEAAEMRAHGHPWDAVAKKVRRHPDVCRKWPVWYQKDWDRFFDEAALAFFLDYSGRSTASLVTLMADQNKHVALSAAKHYNTQFLSLAQRRIAARAADQKTGVDERDINLAKCVRGLSDEQLDDLLSGVRSVNTRKQGASPGAASPPGAG